MKLAERINASGWWESIWNEGESCSDSVISAAQTAHIISMDHENAVKLIDNFDQKLPSLLKTIDAQIKEESKAYKNVELLKASLQ